VVIAARRRRGRRLVDLAGDDETDLLADVVFPDRVN
jgi:hypothetical protein